MMQDQVCPRCGRPLSSDAPRGLCPFCLLLALIKEKGDIERHDLRPCARRHP